MSRKTKAQKLSALEARIVDCNCVHDWRPDAFGSPLEVCFKCWSTRLPSTVNAQA